MLVSKEIIPESKSLQIGEKVPIVIYPFKIDSKNIGIKDFPQVTNLQNNIEEVKRDFDLFSNEIKLSIK